MRKSITQEGVGYRLRPITIDDAQLILDLRLGNPERNKFLHPVENDLYLQQQWIANYLEKSDDYYFVVENALTSEAEGLIGLYNIQNNRADWGRWIIKEGSFAALESVNLLYQIAFFKLELVEVCSHTITENTSTISFHNRLPQKKRAVLKNYYTLNGVDYDAIEHYVTKGYYLSELQAPLEEKIQKIYCRNYKIRFGKLPQ